MKKRFQTIYRDPGLNESGAPAPVSAPSTVSTQSSEAGSQAPVTEPSAAPAPPVRDNAYFEDLTERTEKGYDPTDAELKEYDSWMRNGKKSTETQTSKEASQSTEKQPEQASKPGPKSQSDVEKLITEKAPNQWNDAEFKAVQEAMTRVGAKSPQELLSKTQEALSLAGKKGAEEGNLRKENETIKAQWEADRAEAESFKALFNDLRVGKPEAAQYLRDHGYSNQAIQAFTNQATHDTQKADLEIPDDIIDAGTYKAMHQMKSQFEAQMQAMQRKLDEAYGTATTVKQTIEQREVTARQESERNQASMAYINQFQGLAERDPDLFQVKSAPIVELLHDFFINGKADPRLQNHIELMRFAHGKGIYDLKDAYAVMHADKFTQKLIEAEKRGRESALKQPTHIGLADQRDKSGGSANPQTNYSPEDVRAMNKGDMPPPAEWFTQGVLDRSKIPQELHRAVFGN